MTERTASSVTIAAPRGVVMGVIADFAAYPQWASAVREAEVVARDPEGRPSRVRFRLDAGMVKDSYVLGYEWDGEAGVQWHLAEPGTVISGMDGAYLLRDREGGTEVTYELAVDVRIPMLGMLKRKAEKIIIDTALMGLQRRAETGRGDGG
jgi:Polyketide cyclase / dehydrase and lipid transport